MIRHVWSVVCRSVSIDRQTNSVSLLNILETLVVPGEPTVENPVPLSCEVLSLWALEQVEDSCSGQMRVRLKQPGQEEQDIILLDIDIAHSAFHRTRINIGALPLFSSGWFEFRVEYRAAGEGTWRQAAGIPFQVVVKGGEEDSQDG
jgi:hypothetical protein